MYHIILYRIKGHNSDPTFPLIILTLQKGITIDDCVICNNCLFVHCSFVISIYCSCSGLLLVVVVYLLLFIAVWFSHSLLRLLTTRPQISATVVVSVVVSVYDTASIERLQKSTACKIPVC